MGIGYRVAGCVGMSGPTPEQGREAMDAMAEYERSQTKQAALVWHHERQGYSHVLAVAGEIMLAFEDDINDWFDVPNTPAGPGLWIWEGSARWYGGGYETPHDGEWCLENGSWRRPTEDETRRVATGLPVFAVQAPDSVAE